MDNANEFLLPDLEDMGIELPNTSSEEELEEDAGKVETEVEETTTEVETEPVVRTEERTLDILKEDDEENNEESNEELSTSGVHTPLYNYLNDNEYFPETLIKEYGVPKSAEDFIALVDKRNELYEKDVINHLHSYYIEKFPKTIRPLIDVIQKGETIDDGKIVELISSVYEHNYTDEDLKNPDVASEYLIKSYTKLGTFNKTSVENMVDALSDEEKIAAFQKAYADERQSKQSQIDKLKESQEEELARRKQLGTEFSNTVDSLPWKPSYKNEIKQFVAGGNFKSNLEALTRDPKNLPVLAEFVKYYDPEKGFKIEDYLKLKGKDGGIKEAKKKINNYFDSVPQITKQTAKDQKAINVDKIIDTLDI